VVAFLIRKSLKPWRKDRLRKAASLGSAIWPLIISTASNELCHKLIDASWEMRIEQISHGETLQVSVAFAVVEQAFERWN
jgi:hypothetical protein